MQKLISFQSGVIAGSRLFIPVDTITEVKSSGIVSGGVCQRYSLSRTGNVSFFLILTYGILDNYWNF